MKNLKALGLIHFKPVMLATGLSADNRAWTG